MSDSDTNKHTKPAEVISPGGFFMSEKNFNFFIKKLDFLMSIVYTIDIRNSDTTTIKNQTEVRKMFSKDFLTRKEAKAYAESFQVRINYRISPNYPVILIGRKVKTDKTQSPKSYTLTWTA